MNLGNPPLAADAVKSASELAHTPQQFETIQQIAVNLLPKSDDHAYLALARALRIVPAKHLAIDVTIFANHPNRWLRAFAAVAWARNPDRWKNLGTKLSSDSEPGVRYAPRLRAKRKLCTSLDPPNSQPGSPPHNQTQSRQTITSVRAKFGRWSAPLLRVSMPEPLDLNDPPRGWDRASSTLPLIAVGFGVVRWLLCG